MLTFHETSPAVSPSAAARSTTNRLLSSLPLDDYTRIVPHLKVVPLLARQLLHKQGEPIREVYFPGGGACSLVKAMYDGHSAEVATVGDEGAIGAGVFVGETASACDAVVQAAGVVAHVMPIDAFTAEMSLRGAFFNRIIRYNQALLMQIMQTAACNGLHSAEERCCRWLLMTHDRMRGDEIPLTHEFIATMLGIRRPTVTLVMTSLQRAGLISGRRGHVAIVNREGLEAASCECYAAVNTSFSRLLPELSMSQGCRW